MRRELALCLLLLGCNQPRFPEKTPEEVSAARLMPEDVAIYEALVEAYAANGEILGAPPPPADRRHPLTLAEVESRSAQSENRLQSESNARPDPPQPAPAGWYTLAGERLSSLAVPPDALRDFAARNQRSISLKNYEPRHLRLKRTSDTIGAPWSSILSLTLPGYSPARDAAVVEVSVSTSGLSGGGELVFLRKTGGAWRVIAKQQTWIS